MMLSELLLKGLAVFYLATAFVDLIEHITESYGKHRENTIGFPKYHWINRKPLNCVLCMCIWLAIPIWFVPWLPVYGIPALAGIALFTHVVWSKMRITFV